MTRIYYHKKAILLTESLENYPENTLVIKAEDHPYDELRDKIIQFLSLSSSSQFYLITSNEAQIKKQIFSMFNLLNAAGGLVINHQKQVLLIKRWGLWDFPKGKQEENENPKTCALREVKEETGVKADLLAEKPWLTYHIYRKYNKYNLKQTWWYAMKACDEQPLTPQKEEDIEEVLWVSYDQVTNYLENSYASLKNLWQRFMADTPVEMDF